MVETKIGNYHRLSNEYVKREVEKVGYSMLSDYTSYHSKIDLKCPNNHIVKMSFSHFMRGQRCRYCQKYCNKITIQYVKEYSERYGYKCLSKEYTKARDRNLIFQCDSGHIYTTSWNDFQHGYRCETCYRLNNYGENHPMWCGGISYQEYCSIWKDKEFKDFIRSRDGEKCSNPYCGSLDDLVVHHINYRKKDCRPFNLITICRKCNNRANRNRDKWYEFYIWLYNQPKELMRSNHVC